MVELLEVVHEVQVGDGEGLGISFDGLELVGLLGEFLVHAGDQEVLVLDILFPLSLDGLVGLFL